MWFNIFNSSYKYTVKQNWFYKIKIKGWIHFFFKCDVTLLLKYCVCYNLLVNKTKKQHTIIHSVYSYFRKRYRETCVCFFVWFYQHHQCEWLRFVVYVVMSLASRGKYHLCNLIYREAHPSGILNNGPKPDCTFHQPIDYLPVVD